MAYYKINFAYCHSEIAHFKTGISHSNDLTAGGAVTLLHPQLLNMTTVQCGQNSDLQATSSNTPPQMFTTSPSHTLEDFWILK